MAKKPKAEISESEQSEHEATPSKHNGQSDKKKAKSPASHVQPQESELSMSRSEFEAVEPLDKFLALNPDLERVKCTYKLSKNDLISLLQIPKSIEPYVLIGKCINFDKKTKIKLDGVKYVIRPTAVEVDQLLILGKKVKSIRPTSTLQMNKYIKDKDISQLQLSEDSKIPFPHNLKERHPLFGANYEEKMALDESVQKRLEKSAEETIKAQRKSQKKKKKQEDSLIETEESLFNLFTPSADIKPKKKAKKLANSTVHPDSQLSDFDLDFSRITKEETFEPTDLQETSTKQKKKRSINKSTADEALDHSELPRESTHKKKKSGGQSQAEEEQSITDDTLRKKKKHKLKSENVDIERTESATLPNGDSSITKKKIKTEPVSFDQTTQESTKKKRKIKTEPEPVEPTPKKKKIKKEKEEENKLIQDILCSVKNELESSSSSGHKKKKHSL